jgi:hypothetical protein
MKRWLATVLVFGISSAIVRADITVVQTTTVEGGAAAMAPAGTNMSPKITMRVKGLKSRTDMELPPTLNSSSIVDVAAKQLITLQHDQKTAQTADTSAPAMEVGGKTPPAMTVSVDAAPPAATGKSQVIDGLKCDEYTFSTSMNLAEVTGGQLPPEAAEMMKGLTMVMKGSMWVAKTAPGAEEYVAYQRALAKTDLAAATLKTTGVSLPGLDKMMKAMSTVDGVPYLTVMDMTVEGTGQMADMMRQMMGGMKVTTKVTSLTTDAIGDDACKVPAGYTVIK